MADILTAFNWVSADLTVVQNQAWLSNWLLLEDIVGDVEGPAGVAQILPLKPACNGDWATEERKAILVQNALNLVLRSSTNVTTLANYLDCEITLTEEL